MNEHTLTNRRTRILERVDRPALAPFGRATSLTDASVYWLPVRQFSHSVSPKKLESEFLYPFDQEIGEPSLLAEMFLQLKYAQRTEPPVYTDVTEYQPVTGIYSNLVKNCRQRQRPLKSNRSWIIRIRTRK